MAALVDLSGTCDFDTNDEIEAIEAQEATGDSRPLWTPLRGSSNSVAGGDGGIRNRVESLLIAVEAPWCPFVELKLWNGARGDRELSALRRTANTRVSLEIDGEVWALTCRNAHLCREHGISAPASDIIVTACARRHGVGLEHNDRHFELIDSVITAALHRNVHHRGRRAGPLPRCDAPVCS